MSHAQYTHLVVNKVVDQDVVWAHTQPACAPYPTNATKIWMSKQALSIFCKQFIERERSGRIVGFDFCRWDQVAGIGRIKATLDLAAKPGVVF